MKKNKLIFLFVGFLFLVGCTTYTDKVNDTIIFKDTDGWLGISHDLPPPKDNLNGANVSNETNITNWIFSVDGLLPTIAWVPPDYSTESYVKIDPNNKSRFIYLECINSTLKINNTMLWCENKQIEVV